VKIAIISPILIGIGQTAVTYSSQQLNLALCWADQGHEVDVITSWFPGINEAFRHERIRIMVHPLIWLGGKNGLPLLLGGARILSKKPYDMVFASEHYHPNTALSCLLSRRVVIYQGQNTAGSSWPKRLLFKMLDSLFLPITRRRYYKVVAKTQQAEQFVRQRGFHNAVTIPAGYDANRFRMPTLEERASCRQLFGISDEDGVMVYAGNLLPRRDVGTAIRALAVMRRAGEQAILLIAGEGPDRLILESLVSEEKVGDYVRFLGLLPWKKLRDVYWSGDLFVFPTHYEIFGMVLVEALACGLSLVSTPCPAALDILAENRELGIIVPAGDVDGFAEACKEMLATRRRGSGQADKVKNLLAKMSWQAISHRLIAEIHLATPN